MILDRAPELSMSGLTPETRTRLDGINRLLEDVFKEPRFLLGRDADH